MSVSSRAPSPGGSGTPPGADARRSGGLLAVHAHPDDETLATGALLAVWADAGRPVTVVTCTRGERGEVIGPDLARLEGDGWALAVHRETELAAALAALGVTDHLFLDEIPPPPTPTPTPTPATSERQRPIGRQRSDVGEEGQRSDVSGGDGGSGGVVRFADSGMAWAGVGRAGRLADLPPDAFVAAGLDDAARRLARLLRERRPDVVVTYEPGGGYGHPDHVRAHEVTMRALALAGDARVDSGGALAHVPGAVLWAVVPEDALRAAYRALPALPVVAALLATHPELTLPDPSGPLASVAVPDAAVDVSVEVLAVLDRLVAALAAHVTQVRAIAVEPARVAAAAATARAGDQAGVVGCYALSNDVLAPLLSRESYRFAPEGGSWTGSGDAGWPAGIWPVA